MGLLKSQNMLTTAMFLIPNSVKHPVFVLKQLQFNPNYGRRARCAVYIMYTADPDMIRLIAMVTRPLGQWSLDTSLVTTAISRQRLTTGLQSLAALSSS